MNTAQMELGLAATGHRPRGRAQHRQSRAQWWFDRMRHMVDRACDWESTPAPRPEQIWFAGAHRLRAPQSLVGKS